MKKGLKICAIILASIASLLIILPLVFKDKIAGQVKRAINENINAEISFDSFGLSLIRNFPNASFRLNGLSVVGVDKFGGDTLAFINRFGLSVNLFSLVTGEGFEVKKISIDQPNLFLKVLEDGTANWDIVKPQQAEPDTIVAEQQPVNFRVLLRVLQIRNANIVFEDAQNDILARVNNFNHTLRGDFTADITTLEIRNTTIESLLFSLGGIPYLNNVFVEYKADIEANLKDLAFTFKDNQLHINDLTAIFEGTFSLPADAISMDFRFSSPKTEFKSLLSLVPAIYAKNFEGLKTSGTFEFYGHVKGTLDDYQIPGFGLNIKVDNGMFQYPGLPASIADVFINTAVKNPGGNADLTVVDISRFDLNVAGNPVKMSLNLQTPISDPKIDFKLNGKLDLSKIQNFYPLEEGISLHGVITSNIMARGQMSSIENRRYEEFQFEGSLDVNSLQIISPVVPYDILVNEMSVVFTPQFASLNSFSAKMGESDFSAQGRIDNVLGYALKDELLTGSVTTHSGFLNLNQFMTGAATEPQPQDTVQLSVIKVPANIDFTLRSHFDRLLFGNLEINNANGTIRVVDQTARLENVKMGLLNGTLVLSGSYSTFDINNPQIDFNLTINQVDIQKTFATFNTFRVLAPIGNHALGDISANFRLKSLLDQNLSPVLGSLAGGGSLQSSSISINNSPALIGLANNLGMDMFRELAVRDLDLLFEFSEGRVNVQPFDIRFGNSTAIVQGHHAFDQSINYIMNMSIPRTEFGGAANQVLTNLVSQAAGLGITIRPGETVNVGAAITGTVTDPKVSLTLAQTAADLKDQLKEAIYAGVDEKIQEVQQQAQEVIEDVRQKVSAEAEQRAQRVLSEAEKQAKNLRMEAAGAASKLREEARIQVARLEAEATNPIAMAAARRTGEQILRTADQNATRIENEAEAQSNILLNNARQKADRILAGLE